MYSLVFGSLGICAATSLLGCSSSSGSDSPEETGGYGGYAAFPGGGFPQGGFPQGGSNPQGGYPQGGSNPQGGFPQGGSNPQGGYPNTGGFNPGTGGFNPGTGGFNPGTGGFNPGTGGFNPGTGGDQGQGGAGTGGAGPATPPPCLSAANQGVILGDSYVTGALSPALQPALNALYPFASGFRNYAVAGTSMANGGITGKIPPQWDLAIGAGPVKFIIMDGGGNDILICDAGKFQGCSTICKSPGSSTNPVCQDIVTQAVAAAKALMLKAADAGVKDVVYFFYPHLPGANKGYDEINDYAEPIARASCEAAYTNSGGKLNCYWVSLVGPFAAKGGDSNPANFVSDSIHPSAQGQQIIADEINKVMKAHCVGQQSGCCSQ